MCGIGSTTAEQKVRYGYKFTTTYFPTLKEIKVSSGTSLLVIFLCSTFDTYRVLILLLYCEIEQQ